MQYENLKYFGNGISPAAERRLKDGSPTYIDRMNDCLDGARVRIKNGLFPQALRELAWTEEYAGKGGVEVPKEVDRLSRIANIIYAVQKWDEVGTHLEDKKFTRALETLDTVEESARNGGMYFSDSIRMMRNDVFTLLAEHEINSANY